MGAIAPDLRRFVLGVVEPDLVDNRLVVIPVIRVAHELHVRLHDPILELIGPIGDEVTRTGKPVAMRLDTRAVNRIARRMRQQPEKIRRGGLELNLERVVVERAHSQVGDGPPPGRDRARVQDRIQYKRVPGQRGRIQATPQPVDEIVGHDGIAVGPARVAPQRERIGPAVVAYFPGLRGAGNILAIGRLVDQAFEQISLDVRARNPLALMRVQTLRLRAVTPMKDLNFGEIRPALAPHGNAGRPRGAVIEIVAAAACRERHRDQKSRNRTPVGHGFHGSFSVWDSGASLQLAFLQMNQ